MNRGDYYRNVVSWTQGFRDDSVLGEGFGKDAEKWNMHYHRVSLSYGYYKLGYTSIFCEDAQLMLMISPNDESNPVITNKMRDNLKKSWNVWKGRDPKERDFKDGSKEIFMDFWWCRGGHWRPLWGELTQQHACLIKDLRNYWFTRWLGEQNEKKEILHENTILPTVLIDDIVDSLPYMYQTKRV